MSKVFKRKLYMCSTPYHLLYALVKEINHQDETCIYLSSYDHKIMDYYEKVLKSTSFEKINFFTRRRKKIEDYLFLGFLKDRLEYKKLFLGKSEDELLIFPWNINTLYIHVNYFFKKHSNISFIEDGITAHQIKSKKKYFTFLKKYIYRISDYKDYKKVNNVFVNDISKYDEKIFGLCKMHEESFEGIFNSISNEDKEKIFNLFSGEISYEKEIKKNFNGKSIIILTQPLSEDGYEKESSKKEIYNKIVNKYLSMDYVVYLKKHPRDLSEYAVENDIRVTVLDKFLPSELLAVSNIEFDIALGICTSAINNINAIDKINLKPDYFYNR
ncbi:MULTISPECIES: glycosyltransferase family 52 [unclassified Exiguobacterium]|uniref:glycosyltransferase family 52 n=1 Tax=unclassified Exiguobacterium TaxID=2644629 RepID=UPI001BE55F7F|nr:MULTISPECIES: glycosyltransferase family 52 [unclassified Exiguobacterium]